MEAIPRKAQRKIERNPINMSELSDLTAEFKEFKGEISAGLENLCKQFDRMEKTRDTNSKDHWDKLNKLHDSIHAEATERARADSEIKTEIATTKTKLGIITAGISAAASFIIISIKGMFGGGQ